MLHSLSRSVLAACAVAGFAALAAAQSAPAPAANPLRPAATPPASAPAAPTPATEATKSKKAPSGGLAASRVRQKACGAEWKQKKAAGQIVAGQKWPQFWSQCNTRLKAQGQ